ncbi:MAG: PTS sugar transporter subunit IIA [Thermodesulfobacteriota bacterium]
MKLVDILSKDRIVPVLASPDKKGVIQELVSVLSVEGVPPARLVQVLLEREKLGSTGIGDGVAIPHGRLREVNQMIASFGRSIKGLNFDSLDGKPTHLFFLLVAPENSAGIHLKALARISRLFKDPQFRQTLMSARDQEEIFRIIREEDGKYD